MPPVTRAMIRAALAWMVVGAVLTIVAAGPWPVLADALPWPARLHVWTIGWLTQLILGVAWWLLPTLGPGRGRGPEQAMGAAGLLLNFGLVLRLVGEGRAGGLAWASTAYLGGVTLLALACTLAAGLLLRRLR